jgi:uncharacterized protein (DUF952 family)
MSLIYKILPAAEWRAAKTAGLFEGSAVDHADGFIHFSTAGQAQETAKRYFAGREDLMLLAVPTDGLGEALKWEPSRDGDLFPHLYGSLQASAVVDAQALELDADGIPILGMLKDD